MRLLWNSNTFWQRVRCLAVQCAAIALFSLPCQAQTGQASGGSAADPAMLRGGILRMLSEGPLAAASAVGRNTRERLHFTLINLYLENGIAPRWVAEDGPTQRAYALLSVLQKADEEGLDSAWYQTGDIERLLSSREPENLARLDILLTQALCAYVRDMREGRTAACLSEPALFPAAYQKKEETASLIRDGFKTPDLTHFLELQAPQHIAYQTLKKLLALYRRLATGGWPQIPDGKKIEPGMADARLDLLAQRLLITGDLAALPPPVFSDALPAAEEPHFPADPPQSKPGLHIYDEVLVKGVKHFQARFGMEQDGIVGKTTLAALNISAEELVKRIIANMERWRWLPHELNGRRIIVNIADFTLTVLNDEQAEISMPVIVGEVDNKTPVFSHAMSYIEINPYWNVPPSIVRKEIVEKMKKDPSYLQRERIRIFAGWDSNAPEVHPAGINWRSIGGGINKYRLRQEPGPANALGNIKFVFPNRSNVYLHDTPGQSLFRRARRSFSHGCIRVSQPLDLAVHILRQDGQIVSKEDLKKQIAAKKQRLHILRKPLPVHITYQTAWADPADGTAHFQEDLYGHDILLAEALANGGRTTLNSTASLP